ncbi:TadE/TadG family type IV pilus assembly protein [Embleya sp. NPDC055664]
MSRLLRPFGRLRRRYRELPADSGTTSLQLAILMPVVLVLILVTLQGCLWWFAREAALAAAREGVESGRAYRIGTPQTAAERARQAADNLGLRNPSVSTAGSTADTVRVRVTARCLSIVPLLPDITITQDAQAPVERWSPIGP